MEKLNIFEYHSDFDNEKLESDFNDFFIKYGLLPMFTNESKAGHIYVSYVDMRSVVSPGGRYHNDLLNFADILMTATDNKSYEESVFGVIYYGSTFTKLMDNVRKVIDEFMTMEDKYIHNFWNIVHYTKLLG